MTTGAKFTTKKCSNLSSLAIMTWTLYIGAGTASIAIATAINALLQIPKRQYHRLFGIDFFIYLLMARFELAISSLQVKRLTTWPHEQIFELEK